jgi:sugar lactone lactonase YvrE
MSMNGSSGLQPFVPGDIFVGATILNNPTDNHAGVGRIIQDGADLKQKGTLRLEETTHLVGGLRFDPQGRLWAFDSQAALVLVIHGDGRVEKRDFGGRPFSHVNFGRDGSLYFGEHVVGSMIRPEVAARLRTRIPLMRGTDRFGDGHVFRYDPDGRLIKEYATQTHGGLAGFLGVTTSALAPDEQTLIYCSEAGPRLMRYDLVHDRQLPDLQSFPDGQREMFFAMSYGSDGTLYVLRGTRIDLVNPVGETTRSIPLEGFGWALVAPARDGKHVFAANFLTGEISKIVLATGASIGSLQTGVPKALAGLAEFAGVAARTRSKRKPATKLRRAAKARAGRRGAGRRPRARRGK